MSDDTQQPALTAAERAEIRYQARQNIRPSFVRNEDIRRLLDALEVSEREIECVEGEFLIAERRAEAAEAERDVLAREVGALRAAGNDLASALETAIIARQRVEHWSLESAVHAERFLAAWRAALAEGRPAEAGEG